MNFSKQNKMTIEELNKLIKEELDAYLGEDDDIEVTTDEPGVETGEEALDILRQIFDLIKPTVEPEGDEEEAPEVEDEPADEEPPADEEEPAEEEEGDPESEEEIEEISESDFVGSYNPGPTDFGTGMALLAAVAIGLPLVSFLSMNREDKKEFVALIKANAEDFKAAAKLRGKAALDAVRAAAEKAGLTKFAGQNENLDRPNYKASDVKDVKHDAEKIKGGLNESVDMSARFKKLANIK